MTFSLKSSFKITEKRALLVSADRAILFQCKHGLIDIAYEFSADESGRAQFQRCLNETNPAPIYVLVDIVEEEYRQDVIPHVSGADRRSVLQRKFARLFRGTAYCHAITQGRESDGRKDDKVLLTAITKPDLVARWVELIQESKVPVAGIYSLPILSQRLLKKIGAKSTNVLLISVQAASGLRQTFFRDRQIKISRLAPMPKIGSVPYASRLLGELEKLRRYLNSLALISRDAPLDVYILSHGQWLDELEKNCRDTIDEHYLLLDVTEVGTRLGLKDSLTTAYSDVIFAQLLLDEAPRNHFASEDETRYFSLYRMRNGLIAASIAMLVSSIAWSGFNFLDGVSLKSQALDAQQKANFYQERYIMARGDLPPTPVEPLEIKSAVDVVDTLNHFKSDPLPLLTLISGALNQAPTIRLEQIKWHAAVDPNDTGERTRRRRKVDESKLLAKDAKYSHYHIAVVKGSMSTFSNDYRGAIAEADKLAARLAEHPDVRLAEVVEYPLDVTSQANVVGNARDADQREPASFAVKVILGVVDVRKQS